MLVDFYDDSTGAVLREILMENADSVPDCVVKSASLVPSEAFREEKRAFGWPAKARFALDTPEDAWLSGKYFEKVAHLIPFQHHEHIIANITNALHVHGFDRVFEKEASIVEEVALGEDDFALVVKSASGEVMLADYPVNTKEAAEKSIAWYPRGLNGELTKHRAKVAASLVAHAESYGLGLTDALLDDTRAIKASSLIDEVGMRIGRIYGQNAEAARTYGLMNKAASMGRELPYDVQLVSPVDARFITAYEELGKEARKEPIPKSFFTHLGELDKVAGFDLEGLSPASVLSGREIEYDVMPAIAKLAGTYINIDELMDKIGTETWHDLAPELMNDIHSPVKLAAALPHLPEHIQKILLTKTRGF